MKKIIKYLLCLVLIVVFIPANIVAEVKSCSVNVNKEVFSKIDSNSYLVTDTGTLTVNGVVSNDTFAAYKVLDTFYNCDKNTITYEFTSDFKNFLASTTNYKTLTVEQYSSLTSGSITGGSTTTNSTLDTLVSQYATYIKSNNISGNNMTVSNTSATANLPAGAYLVLPNTTKKVYAVMIGNIEFKANNSGDWELSSPTITAKVSDVGLTKIIKETNSTEGSFGSTEEYTYQINVTVPTYPTNATNTTLIVNDKLDNGIYLGGNNIDNINQLSTIKIKDGTTTLTTSNSGIVTDSNGHTVATITKSGITNLTINFNQSYLTSNNITIEYTASLNHYATIGSTGNNTKTSITYATDPYSNGNSTTDEITTTVFTYGIDLFKKNSLNEGVNGARYSIYSDSSLTNEVGQIYTKYDGHGTAEVIASGTYYIKETEAPAGYKINNDIITVNIDTTKDYTSVTTIDEKMGLLPSTGSIGTYIFIICGAILVIIALFLIAKRKNKNDFKEK